ncbi:MAG: phenylalanine--tRNA ligase subunit alpha [Deltaproteobacteria bacterium]|nr:phenylalanine--tRNA ligase subunit alpha [Deltaproteobacteria bacterium]
MTGRLERLLGAALSELKEAAIKEAVLQLKAKYLGRKGELAGFFTELGSLPPEEKKAAGEAINRVKGRIEEEVERLLSSIEGREKAERLGRERVDITLPGRTTPPGRVHPVTQVTDEIEDIFTGLGFEVAEGPEVEIDYYNFEALNFPKDHPARDMQDTFFIGGDVLLRTHTSSVQPRVMQSRTPPLRVIAPGTVYRRDSDITHSPMFHQVEGFMVDKGIRFSDLKGTLTHFLHRLFGEKTGIRFRPSFFPFTEPSAEVDIRCVICKGSGCRVCKGSGWLEILGAGMIHPEVFKAVNYDPEEHTGFAFGLGIERIAMLKFGIDDLRLLFENDVRFLGQF